MDVDSSWNVTVHAQKPDFVFRRKGRVHLNRWGRQLAAEVCASAVVMQDTPCSEVVWRVLATHSIRQFPLHFPFRASPCAITFQLDSNWYVSTTSTPHPLHPTGEAQYPLNRMLIVVQRRSFYLKKKWIFWPCRKYSFFLVRQSAVTVFA